MSAPTLDAATSLAADLVLPEGAPRARWLVERTHGIGGSDVAGILGLSRWSSPYQVWLDKTGRSGEQDDTWPMFRGREDETKLRRWFTRKTGIDVVTTGMWRSRSNPLAFANPDGLTTDGGGLECKSHSWRMADEWDEDQVSDAAELQSQWYMGVTGLKHWWVIAQLGDDEPVIRRLEFDADLFASLLATAKTFWHDYVLADREPPVGFVDLDAVKDRYRVVEVESVPMAPDDVEPLIGEWESARAAVKAAEQRAAVALATLRNVVGAAEQITVAGRPRLTCKQNGTFAAARFAADHPDVAASLSTKPALDLERVKSEHPELYQAYRARVLRAVTTKEK